MGWDKGGSRILRKLCYVTMREKEPLDNMLAVETLVRGTNLSCWADLFSF